MSVNKQLAPALPDITPSNEWSKSTQDEIFKQAEQARGLADADPSAAMTSDKETSQTVPASHPGGNIPESLVQAPEATPISPVTVGASQPGYGNVHMYNEAPAVSPMAAQQIPAAAPTDSFVPSDDLNPKQVESSGLAGASLPPLPMQGTADVAPPTQGYPAPPALNRVESTASTVLEIPGAWGRDKPSAPVQSAGPEGGDKIVADAMEAFNNAAAQAPAFFQNIQTTVGQLVDRYTSPTTSKAADPEAGVPPSAGLITAPEPADRVALTNNTSSSSPPKSPVETMSPAPVTIPSPAEHKEQLHSPAVDGIPAGESRSNTGTTHVGNYAMTDLPNSDEGNVTNPQPGLLDRAKQAVAGVQASAADAYNSEAAGAAKDTGNHYLEMGMAALGLGAGAAVVASEEKKEEEQGGPTSRHTPGVSDGQGGYISPAERAARGMGPAEAPEGNKYGNDPSLDASEHPIQTTTTGLPPVTSQPTPPAELSKPDAVDVPVGNPTYGSMEPYENNQSSKGLEDRAPIRTNSETKPLPEAPAPAPAPAARPSNIDTAVASESSGQREVQSATSVGESESPNSTMRGSAGESKKRRSSLGSKIKSVFSKRKD